MDIEITTEDLIIFAIILVIIFLFAAICLFINKLVFRRLQKDGKRIHLTFFERMNRIVIIALACLLVFSCISGFEKIWSALLGSTVVIGGIIGFAAQGIIKDVLAGLMLSIHRPFEIGDRILLNEIEKPCVVEDLTISHTILKTMDNIRYIVPNSEINSKIITNTSYHQVLRGTFIKIRIGLYSDVRKAIFAVREAIRECPYTCPNNEKNADLGGYGEVYVMDFLDSALLLETVIWTEPETDNFLACSEVRLAIMNKLAEIGIKVPYTYINVQMSDKEEEPSKNPGTSHSMRTNVGKRNTFIKTDAVNIGSIEDSYEDIYAKAEEFSVFHGLSPKDSNTIRLLSEELMNFLRQVFGDLSGLFWIEGYRHKVQICLNAAAKMDSNRHLELIGISSKGKNAAAKGFVGILREMIALYPELGKYGNSLSWTEYKNSTDDPEAGLEKTILTSIADDINVNIEDQSIRIVVYKYFSKKKVSKK
ncbi:MAG: mechanosensitive ion channel [Lachnospiraceae bacterium]|nr:mechanosensitive ion channel [Lachnospiraceae bacterium]